MSLPERLTQPNVRDLVDLMDSDLVTFYQKLQNFGGVDGLCTLIQNRNNDVASTNQSPDPTDGVPRLTSLVWSGFNSRDLRLLRIQFYLQMTPYLIAHLFQFLLGFGVEHEDEYYGHVEVSVWVKFQTALTYVLICLPLGVSAFLHGWTNYKVMSAFMGGVLNTRTLTVIRDGVTHENFLKSDLVIGDVCLLSPGSVSPADGVWVEGLIQPDVDPRVYCDQVIRSAGGKMIILAVGENTVMARSAASANVDGIRLDGAGTTNKKTILEDKLHSFSTLAIKLGFAFAILTTAFIFVRFSVEKYMIEKQVWAMAHAQRFVAFIVTGFLMFSRTLPDLVPLALVISLEVARYRLTRCGGVFLKNMHILTTFAGATTLLIEKECIDKTTSRPSDVAKAIKLCRRAAMVVRVLVPSPSNGSDSDSNPNLPKSFGFTRNDCISLVVDNRPYPSAAGIIRTLTDSGEIVALVSTGEDPQAILAAHVGIVLNENGLQEHGRPCIGPCDLHICAKNELRMSTSFNFPQVSQIRCIFALVFFIILGYILSPDSKVKPQLLASDRSLLNLTTKLMKKNIVGQILYQMAVVVALLIFSTMDKLPYVDLTSEWFPLTRDEWFICWGTGVGSLICYQVCRLIPIGREQDGKACTTPPNIPCSSVATAMLFVSHWVAP